MKRSVFILPLVGVALIISTALFWFEYGVSSPPGVDSKETPPEVVVYTPPLQAIEADYDQDVVYSIYEDVQAWQEAALEAVEVQVDLSKVASKLQGLHRSEGDIQENISRLSRIRSSEWLLIDYIKNFNQWDEAVVTEFGQYLINRSELHWEEKEISLLLYLDMQDAVLRSWYSDEAEYQQQVDLYRDNFVSNNPEYKDNFLVRRDIFDIIR